MTIKTSKFFHAYKYNYFFVCISSLANIGNKNDLLNLNCAR
ncbi:hypothetical protein HMPREF1411_01251 [Helicobacter pylori GAM250AFi]|nr:hypothetical protein HMPREF1395_01318 [Helicobacter pylori GAM112Ai]EMH08625.1 hypothetical protein HMPREF1411_01251 [Helicobacter pylori GAM250AFi]EMH15925.1 hypothetical protein HMPREF1412_00178 [Helicobacter pylori GAM250T]EMH32394.1 hypothetical protein HMPREF1424_01125 [Helicobacter pylori GAM42Ai]EMH45822.1 hypothetical protein HMPREF1438_01436 [Helicobacter pylori HP250AFii]EMH46405.1 hypothetical protein HMPREF1439_01396 [Helicobacter pylori HP250AFiii]EMH50620.1 hypothetical prote